MKKLKKDLKNYLRKERFIVDIFLFGSAVRSKEKPRDIDVITLLREKNYKKAEAISYEISKIGRRLKLNLHIEPLVVDNMHKEKVYASILHEGFSVKNEKFLSEMVGFKAYSLISYSLAGKGASEKVRFSYALYGRKPGEGFLSSVKGREVGKAAILVPIEKDELAKEFFEQWKIEFKIQRVTIFE